MANKVAASMPPMTAVPMVWREMAPDPVAVQSGTQPRMKAKAVMRIGRKRTRAPASAASKRFLPPSYSALQNSTMRMAFLAARPMSMMSAICA